MEMVNLRKLNDVEVREQYQVKLSNRFAASENLMMMMMMIGMLIGLRKLNDVEV
jgi:hypothetical protein